jgi:hypothetical protein
LELKAKGWRVDDVRVVGEKRREEEPPDLDSSR